MSNMIRNTVLHSTEWGTEECVIFSKNSFSKMYVNGKVISKKRNLEVEI